MLPIFEYTDADRSVPDELEEARLIAIAQGHPGGSPDAAKARLIEAYGPALRAAVRNFGHGITEGHTWNNEVGTEDLESTALLGFLSLIEDHDPEKSPRLAGRVAPYLARFLSEEFGSVSAFTVPTRTLSRFYGILKAAEGDAQRGEELAPQYEMTPETFRDVYAAVRGTGSLDEATDETDHGTGTATKGNDLRATPVHTATPVADVEDRILVDMAFRAMDDDELRVCELYYGFTEYDPVPDAEIAHRIGASRPAVQRKRMRALSKARKALGVELEKETPAP